MHSSSFLRASKAPKASKPKLQPTAVPAYKTPTRKPSQPFQPASAPAPKPKSRFLKARQIPFALMGMAAFGYAGYIGYNLVALRQPAPTSTPIAASAQQDVSSRYDSIATSFDSEVDWTEWTMGIKSLRKKLAKAAHGDVLEVSIGTGRNLEFYDWNFRGHNGVGNKDYKGVEKNGKVRSFTAVDKSEEMLEVAHEKFGKMFPGILGVRWVIADAAEKGAIPGPPKNANERSGNLAGGYDTVIQTFGLCSVSDPVALLKTLGESVKEEDGRILLLEHGRGRWDWMNNFLDKSAERHANEFGCWWNRDIREIVDESGLEVVKIETPKWWHGGTTWWVELKKPKPGASVIEKVAAEVNAAVMPEKKLENISPEPEKTTAKKGWW